MRKQTQEVNVGDWKDEGTWIYKDIADWRMD